MPKFGLTMHEGTIQRFFKAAGERVNAGEPLYEVETEKVLYEVEAPASGSLAMILFDEGATVECGVAVAVIAEDGRGCRRNRGALRKVRGASAQSRFICDSPPTGQCRRRPPTRVCGTPQVRLPANSRLNSASISTKSKALVPVDGSPAKTSSAHPNPRRRCSHQYRQRRRPPIASRFVARAR